MKASTDGKKVRYAKFTALGIAVASLFALLFLVGDTDAGANWAKPGHRVAFVGLASFAILVAAMLHWVQGPPPRRKDSKVKKPPAEPAKDAKKEAVGKSKTAAKPKPATKKKASANPKVDQADSAAELNSAEKTENTSESKPATN